MYNLAIQPFFASREFSAGLPVAVTVSPKTTGGVLCYTGFLLFRIPTAAMSARTGAHSTSEKRGRSVIAAAAYRAGTKLMDEVREKTFDYTRRVKGVIQSMILAPEGAPAWVLDSGQLWNTVERSEKRVCAIVRPLRRTPPAALRLKLPPLAAAESE